ncbi:MAG: KDO2-lipid IV(A) lauroyltransferase [Phycisphaerales bacterium]|jgi:KDO2-lipid IV(A) lauroyltransferase
MARPKPPETLGARLRQQAVYHAVRAGLSLPQVAGLETSVRVTAPIARAYGGSRMRRHKVNRIIERLAVAMPELSHAQRHELVMASYEHLATLGTEFLLSPRLMSEDGWANNVTIDPICEYMKALMSSGPVILVTGHCGNWEVLGYSLGMMGFPISAIYRPFDLAPLDRWAREVRMRRGLNLIDKFEAMRKLPQILGDGGMVAIVADQNAGDRGVQVPFFNRLASTYKLIGLMAMEFNAPIIIGQAVRRPRGEGAGGAGGMGFRIEMQDAIRPEDWADQPHPLYYITARYRLGIERMIRRAPEQYLWMHRIWKSRPRHERMDQPFPPALRGKLASLPWMDEAQLENLVHRSDLDRAWLREHKTDRFT